MVQLEGTQQLQEDAKQTEQALGTQPSTAPLETQATAAQGPAAQGPAAQGPTASSQDRVLSRLSKLSSRTSARSVVLAQRMIPARIASVQVPTTTGSESQHEASGETAASKSRKKRSVSEKILSKFTRSRSSSHSSTSSDSTVERKSKPKRDPYVTQASVKEETRQQELRERVARLSLLC
jgi:hypothetical protein